MVQLINCLYAAAGKRVRQYMRSTFIDTLRLTIRGGHGGNGLPKYGGVGGQGGCVYLIAKEDATMRTVLKKYPTKRISASNGEDSSKLRILGRRGVDEAVEVPVGVQVLDEKENLLGDLNQKNTTCLVAGGGMGGCTGTSFIGKPGDNSTIKLDLKLIADVGLVGFPNAGKSTFLKAISKASPKIASYPFTTIRPQIGIVDYTDYRQISIADLPGLIEGAHANIGMGHKFLKHVERTRLLLIIVDIFGFQLRQDRVKRSCIENVYSLNKELELYDETLLDKPCVLLVNKMDCTGSREEFSHIEPILHNLEEGVSLVPKELRPTKLINFERIIPISAINCERVDMVKNDLRKILDDFAEKKLENDLKSSSFERQIKEIGPRIT